MKKSILLACIASTISSGLMAEEQSTVEVNLGAARYLWDGDRNLDDSNSLELGAELPLTKNLSLEAWLSDFDADSENSSAELDANRYTLGGLYHLSEDSLRPFISLGLGQQDFEYNSNTHSETVAYLGAGVKKYFDNNIILRGELLALNSLDNEVTDMGARIAIGYAFGRSNSKPVVDAVAEPVKQEVTQAPAAQEKTVVEYLEKEATTANAPAPAPAETTPAPALVPAAVEAAPVDTDQDGIIDSLDKCEGTDKAFKVDESGCPIMLTETVSITMNVKFPTNSAEIAEDNFPEIQKVADFMKQFEQTSVTVEGYSDDRGRAAYNKSLSQKRADAVRTSLIDTFKVDSQRVSAMGYGEENPIADNNTAEGRAANRRVVAVVKSSIQKAETK